MTTNDSNNKKSYRRGKIRDVNVRLIVEAAEQEFAAKGYRGASMQAIADAANLPKANIHYYFQNKENLYRAVLENITELWNEVLDDINADDDPAEVLPRFIRQKVALSFSHPHASKLFAMEIVQGAPYLQNHIRTDMFDWVKEKTKVIDSWVKLGKMRQIDSTQLIFLIWSSTQHYADFDAQVLPLMNRKHYLERDKIAISNFLCDMIMRGCGLDSDVQPDAEPAPAPAQMAAPTKRGRRATTG